MCDVQLRKDIDEATAIISNHCNSKKRPYEKYDKISIRATENVKELFEHMNGSFERSLIVTGSGDQSLEAVLYGAKEIDSFDINILAKYGSALKFAAVEALEYEEFCDFYKKMFPYQLYKRVREFLKDNYLLFWDSIFEFSYNYDVYHSLFNPKDHKKIIGKDISVYSKKRYYKIKDNISKTKVQYQTCNLLDIQSFYCDENSYDFIYLSNIFYYIRRSPKQFSKFLMEKIYPLLNENGEAVIHYLYGTFGTSDNLLDLLLSNADRQNKDQEVIEKLHKYLQLNEYLVECSGYGGVFGEKDVVLSLKR